MAGATFNHYKKFDPNYNPYGSTFTERQNQIIRGMDPGHVRLNELTTIIKKAERLGYEDVAMEVIKLYEELLYPEEPLDYTVEEAQAILQSMTPWKIKWI